MGKLCNSESSVGPNIDVAAQLAAAAGYVENQERDHAATDPVVPDGDLSEQAIQDASAQVVGRQVAEALGRSPAEVALGLAWGNPNLKTLFSRRGDSTESTLLQRARQVDEQLSSGGLTNDDLQVADVDSADGYEHSEHDEDRVGSDEQDPDEHRPPFEPYGTDGWNSTANAEVRYFINQQLLRPDAAVLHRSMFPPAGWAVIVGASVLIVAGGFAGYLELRQFGNSGSSTTESPAFAPPSGHNPNSKNSGATIQCRPNLGHMSFTCGSWAVSFATSHGKVKVESPNGQSRTIRLDRFVRIGHRNVDVHAQMHDGSVESVTLNIRNDN